MYTAVLVLLLCAWPSWGQHPDNRSLMNKVMHIKEKQWKECKEEHLCPSPSAHNTVNRRCINGFAGEYPCCGIDLHSFIAISTLGGAPTGEANDIWGWTDSVTGREIAIIGLEDGTSFVDVTHPHAPHVLGFLPTQTFPSTWRDIKVYRDHAFIVSEAKDHGMQIYDLTQLRHLERRPFVTGNNTFNTERPPHLQATAWYGGFGNSHNIVINEHTGFAYSVGTRTCRGGLHMINIQDPIRPIYAGCYDEDGYTHDAQCVIYHGPHVKYVGREICFNYNEDSLTIVDVTDKASPVTITVQRYGGSAYTHQGWLFLDHTHLLMDDELDEYEAAEAGGDTRTRTLIWDVSDLTAPVLAGSHYSVNPAIDHNLYIVGHEAFLANYCDGLRVLDVSNPNHPREVAYFDVAPDRNSVEFFGSWSSYPYFESGTIVVSSIERGLFVLARNGQSC